MFNVRSLIAGALLAGAACFAQQSWGQQAGIEVQLEKGKCPHHRSPDGMFYQGKFQTNNELTPGCSSLAFAGLFTEMTGWRVAYHDFGTIRARDNRFIRRDDELAAPPTTPCDPQTVSGCYGTMYGEGHTRGISLAITQRFPYRGIDFIGEAGLLLFNSEFHAWAQTDEDKQILYVKEESTWKTSPPAPMIGAGIRYQNVYIMARRYVSLGHRAQSLTDFNITEFVAGFAIPL